jgi:hypothetical protein
LKSIAVILALVVISVGSPSQGKPTKTIFISCSSAPDGGLDWYFSAVFPAQMTGKEVPTAERFAPDRASVSRIMDAFNDYLSQKHYKFKPGGAAACDSSTNEATAKAAKHRRAYEGNPCSNCGKVIETGWKYGAP